jgi:hypothetical protein
MTERVPYDIYPFPEDLPPEVTNETSEKERRFLGGFVKALQGAEIDPANIAPEQRVGFRDTLHDYVHDLTIDDIRLTGIRPRLINPDTFKSTETQFSRTYYGELGYPTAWRGSVLEYERLQYIDTYGTIADDRKSIFPEIRRASVLHFALANVGLPKAATYAEEAVAIYGRVVDKQERATAARERIATMQLSRKLHEAARYQYIKKRDREIY